MRIIRFVYRRSISYGILNGDEIINLSKLSKIERGSVPSTIEGLIGLGLAAEGLLKRLMGKLSDKQRKELSLKRSDVTVKAPIVAPSKIICLGLNYRDHAEEAKRAIPDELIIFMKPRTTIIGPEELIIKPNYVRELDYEVELAVVIGRMGKNIQTYEAKNYIFGYTAFNDISARDIQFKDGQWTRGKSFDTFAPIGPCINIADQIGDPNDLRIRTRVNGEIRQNSSTRLMVFNVYEIIHHLSRVMMLEPCDIIATGTPAGVAAFMKPEPKFLKSGDIVEVEVEKIGTLKNKVIETR